MKKHGKTAFSIVIGVIGLMVGLLNLLRSSNPDILLATIAFGVVALILIQLYVILNQTGGSNDPP